MGCVCSSPCPNSDNSDGDVKNRHKYGTQNDANQLELSETKTAKFGGVTLRYGLLSQRGFYPDESDKPNQDSYSITNDIANEASDAMFAVYDGHGRHGDLCAQYARDHLPTLVSNYSKKMKRESRRRRSASNNASVGGEPNNTSTRSTSTSKNNRKDSLTRDQIETACSIAHKSCNVAMHREPALNDSLSGTTAISCLFHGDENRIVVSNVGDSRAVLGQKIDRTTNNKSAKDTGDGDNSTNAKNANVAQSYRALPLSSDQTPYRGDERKRIRATGARILSLDQIEGVEPILDDDDKYSSCDQFLLGEVIDEGGDPPRVWSPHGDYPGTAFTRSFGDSIAERLGVFAEPEILVRELMPEDRIIVLATDGVFEFLTNQSVIDICAKFDDPLEACRAVVAESYELWLQFELRTDDITMICIFVDSIDGKTVSPAERVTISNGGATDEHETPPTPSDSRPVRSGISKNAEKALMEMKDRLIDDTDEVPESFDIKAHHTVKTDDEETRISEAINSVSMLKSLTPKQKEMVIGLMEPITVKKDDWIIRQGTVGDRFFIVDDGCFEVRKVPQGDGDKTGTGGTVVHTYNGTELNRYPTFGEFALINSKPRAASVVAKTDGKLWALHKYSYREIFANADEHETKVTTNGDVRETNETPKGDEHETTGTPKGDEDETKGTSEIEDKEESSKTKTNGTPDEEESLKIS
eukprot:CAMPEP_0198253578 /NCGR_PEP_ID=MMETSP1447-20131203/3981_1 /TAXON_ID=420782 /ORGANISM="Chaetoceros dichaeta, Strain CCMP1751" /LENGTH=698 /DNA_ID=CAMNT_0043939309 /DNA_START=19 /DNA_END=2115 /DNA_ORIENTATION=+